MSETRHDSPLRQARERVQKLRDAAPGDQRQELDAILHLLDDAAKRGEDAGAETLRARLDEVIQTTAKFTSLMVHEIRIPLTSIKGYSDMLAKHIAGPLNEMQQQFAETVRSNVSRMENLVTDVSDASKLYAGRIRLDPKLDLYKNIALQVEKDLSGLASDRGVTLTFETPSGLPMLNIDGERLALVLRKLVANALQYTPEGGQVTVCAEAAGDRLKVSVMDTGIGMSPEDQAHVGERFWRSEDERVREIKGHGLGLSIAMGMIALMGGEFFFTSERDKGSTFGFTLPAARAELES
ncbi:MAG: HAMP domain-containing histidine kinase [Anaerolineae bacterium]|jgi:signal transduction histidine kinase|nr:HAMP domain-containing histidine kinase [Anaerolineae bacterium]